MKSTRLGTNVKDRQNAENRLSELRKRDFRAGAPTARFSSCISAQRRESATRSSESETFASHMKSTPFSATRRIGHLELRKRDFRAGLGNCRLLLKFILKSTHFSSSAENRKASFSSWPRKRPFFTRVLRHVLAQTQRVGQSELQKRDFTNLQATLSALVQPGQVLKLLCARIISKRPATVFVKASPNGYLIKASPISSAPMAVLPRAAQWPHYWAPMAVLSRPAQFGHFVKSNPIAILSRPAPMAILLSESNGKFIKDSPRATSSRQPQWLFYQGKWPSHQSQLPLYQSK